MSRLCPQCASTMQRFESRSQQLAVEGDATTVENLSGWSCPSCDEAIFDDESAKRYAAAGDVLILAARARRQDEIRRIRKRLKLTQIEASHLVGVGKVAFSRYECGKTQAPGALIKLLRLIDRHPELIDELRAA